jgi:hypothetical protein
MLNVPSMAVPFFIEYIECFPDIVVVIVGINVVVLVIISIIIPLLCYILNTTFTFLKF